ncbi:hypothetical protein DesyoDRAFT_2337 [Desulfosporosinus youngiae DSM 17734]|uniref:Uncharacterized protein n=1 Tax=Desulfosporosinus youngiae DSM 17734 TaxID=768710 RepID=H5XUW5_9FIRM|nr:hypothetical protein DesyoDRAFT_2337 [Desulfosporosinus youngiae DSM 17734]
MPMSRHHQRMKRECSGRAASPHPLTAAFRGSPTRRCGTPPNLRVIPDVNPWLRIPAPSCGLLPPLHAMGSLLWTKLPCLRVWEFFGMSLGSFFRAATNTTNRHPQASYALSYSLINLNTRRQLAPQPPQVSQISSSGFF